MRVTIFGTGYVGLVTGTCLADVGHDVVCVDIDQAKVDGLNRGVIPIYEPGLEPMVKANHAAGRLRFTTDAAAAIAPRRRRVHRRRHAAGRGRQRRPASTCWRWRARSAATSSGRWWWSTSRRCRSAPPTRCARRSPPSWRRAARTFGFDVVSNPEFLKEGDAVNDCMRPDRIVIGASSAAAVDKLKRLYAPFNRNHERIVVMDVRSAELTKYAANAMLATKISFMNEIANIAEKVGADVEMVRQGIGSDPRIGWHFIYPGAGYGGSCFPKDVQALAKTAQQHGYDAQLLGAVESVNDRQKEHLFELIGRHYDGAIAGKTFAVWGLAFKPNTDDMREASSRRLLQLLWDAGAKVRAYDPEASDEAQRIFGERDDLVLCDSARAALADADALVVVTEWKQFRSPDFQRLGQSLADRVIFDGRNLYHPDEVEAAGLAYYGIGRGRSILID